jgi:hypothetical protein
MLIHFSCSRTCGSIRGERRDSGLPMASQIDLAGQLDVLSTHAAD